MANEILSKFDTGNTLTITVASLASSAARVGRQSTIVDNTTNRYTEIHLYVKITVGTSPTANTRIAVYLIKSDGTNRSDGAGASDAAWTQNNAMPLGFIVVPATTSDTAYYGEYVIYDPGPEWGVGIEQNTGAALNATAGNHTLRWTGANPEVQ